MIRILVVEDSLTVRKRLREVLSAEPQFEVVGEAQDGKQAIDLCLQLRPDVITMDVMMPVMTGLAATEYIMAHQPTPILVVSASINRGEVFHTYDALAAGAVDVLDKPDGAMEHDWERRLVDAVRMVSRIRVITHLRARSGSLRQAVAGAVPALRAPGLAPPGPPGTFHVLALGASTGGPGALVEVLRELPAPLRVPVLVVLHINEPFGRAFADWLDAQTPHRVACAHHGDDWHTLQGRITVAPPDRHMVLREGRIHLTHDAPRHSCRPSVDSLFDSLAQACGAHTAACLLTGMGRDGASGLLAIRRAGGLTIAQDEATSVVYGMPREAALLGAAQRVLPLGEIGRALAALPLAPTGAERG